MDPFRLFQLTQILLGFYTWTLVGQGVLFLFTGGNPRNLIMWLFRKINVPVTWLTRRLAPRFIPDRHIGFLAFALVIVLRVLVYALFYRAGYIPSMSPTGPAPGSG